MARKPRIEYAGAVYHVMSRGNRQEAIFRDNRDREIFLDTLEEACAKTGWVVHAFVLMGNHYHLLLETPEANLVAGMKWLQGTYTQRFNVRHKLWGHLFQGRYKALPIDTDHGDYFSVLGSYIHLNPARAKLFDLENGKLSDFLWSSYPLYLKPSKRPGWLRVDRVLGAAGWEDTAAGRSAYQRMMQKRVAEIAGSESPHEVDSQWADIRRGWFCGEESFREMLLNKLDDVIGGQGERDSFSGQEVRLHDEAEAERLVCKGLARLKLNETDLLDLPKGAEEKKAIITLLKKRTHAGNKWIVTRLQAGHAANIPRYMADVKGAAPGSRLREVIRMLECED
jgi:REP element-mobilizing transposase RayT